MTINGMDEVQSAQFFRILADSTGVSAEDAAESMKILSEIVSEHQVEYIND